MTGSSGKVDLRGREGGALVALVEDHELFGAALGAALQAKGFEVVVPRLSGLDQAREEMVRCRPAVTLLDLDLGAVGNGEELLPALVAMGSRVIVVSGAADEPTMGRCIRAGAWGWVSKSSPLDRLVHVVGETAAGRSVLDARERDRLLRSWREQQAAQAEALAPFDRLSRREAEVLSMLQDGKSVERIAKDSYVSEATVRTQVRAVLVKLGVNSQLEAVAKATRVGWEPPAA